MEILDQPIIEKFEKSDRFGKVLRIVEYVAIFFLLVGILFRVMHWPFGSESLLIGFALLAINYFPFSILYAIVSKRFGSLASKGIMVLMSIALSFALIGVAFRVFFSSFGPQLIWLGTVFLIPAFILGLLSFTGKIGSSKSVAIWGMPRLLIVGVPLCFFLFVNGVEYYGMVGIFRNVPRYMEAYAKCHNENDPAACETINAFEEKFFSRNDWAASPNKQERMLSGEEWID